MSADKNLNAESLDKREKNSDGRRAKFDYNNAETLLTVSNLKQYFKLQGRDLKAVDDISFDVKRGEVFGIVGESGSGKTTTGRSIVGIYDITGGDVVLGGKLINTGILERKAQIRNRMKANDTEGAKKLKEELKQAQEDIRNNRDFLHKKIQMIFQDPISSLDPRMTVREIISEGLIIQGEKNKALINGKVDNVLNEVGLLVEHADRYPHEFSGGQRQRIGIARAIVMDPDMIIADEPVSALDVSVQAQVINLLNDLREEMNLTVIFIAHDLAVVKYISDRIAVMYNGKIVEFAESDELFARPMHPYTRSLLSAIPIPDPNVERVRKRINYVPALEHDYAVEGPKMNEAYENHFVYCNSAELEKYKALYD